MKKGNYRMLIRNLRKMEENKQLNIGNVSRSFSKKDMISFGNFIRDNYYGVGSPRLISYEPDKRPHGTIEDIYKFWLAENYG